MTKNRTNCFLNKGNWMIDKSCVNVVNDYCYASIIDTLTDDRQHIIMRGCCYIAPPLISTCYVVYQSDKRQYQKEN